MTTNFYFWLILFAVVGFWLLDLIANWLNLCALEPSLPDSFNGIYDEAEYRRMVEYTGARTRFEAVDSSVMLGIFLLFWLLGGYGWMDRFACSFQQGSILTGLIFFGCLALGQGVVGLPFSIYGTFVIEERFGFNKSTPWTFVSDVLKAAVLGAVLGGGFLALVLPLLDSPSLWLYAWGATALLMLLMSWIAPAVILPMFNNFTPLPDGELKRAILAYADAQKFPLAGLFVMDGSKRSTKANAFFTGMGRMKKIALYDTLIDSFIVGNESKGVDELVAVLAHEVGHFKRRHIWQGMAFSILNIGAFFFLAQHFVKAPGLFAAFGIQSVSTYAGLALFMLLFKPLSALGSLLQGALSRRNEYQADRFAAETTGHPEAMIRALKKLSKNNLSNLAPHPLYVVLNHSHPPLLKRIEAIGSISGSH